MFYLLGAVIVVAVGLLIFFLEKEIKEKERIREKYSGIEDVELERQVLLQEVKKIQRHKKTIESDIEASNYRLATLEQRVSDEEEILQNELRSEFEREMSVKKQKLNSELSEGKKVLNGLKNEIRENSLEAAALHAGLYEPIYDFEDSDEFKAELDRIRKLQKELIKKGGAAVCNTTITLDGDIKAGARLIKKTLDIMLFSFNGSCDSAIAKVKYNNFETREKAIFRAFKKVNKFGESHKCVVTNKYRDYKLEELHLVHGYEEMKYKEREEQKQIRAEMREELKAKKELEKAQRKAEEEERQKAQALEEARRQVEAAVGEEQTRLLQEIEALQKELEDAHSKAERAISQAQLTRSGHVYVISNVGSFGKDIFKVGLTRRLEPMDRIRELGDASVPFRFDVHAIIYSEDAPTLETALHQRLDSKRLNRVNTRKEFFHVSLAEIEQITKELAPKAKFRKTIKAREFRETLQLIQENSFKSPSHWEGIKILKSQEANSPAIPN